MEHYKKLSKVDVSGMTEKKNGMTYLTWSKAFAELLKEFPEATYEIKKFEDGKPYYIDNSGAIVFTSMTIEGVTREMFLPVLDGANKPMRADSYKYTTKFKGEQTCQAINMFDINKAIMRCLVKNIAVFGLGLNIYAKEDLPLGEEVDLEDIKKKLEEMETPDEVRKYYNENKGKGKELENLIIARGKKLKEEYENI
jgi:hypothetical protein